MNNLTLFETFILWLCRNKRAFNIEAEDNKPRMYKQSGYAFIELTTNVILIVGEHFCYQANNINDVIRIASAIR